METRVPDDPDRFFTEFFPQQYELYPEFPRQTTAGKAAFEVTGAGVWSLAVLGRKLHVERGSGADCVLRLTTSKDDFAGLFVRRAADAFRSEGELSRELRHAFMPLFIDQQKLAITEGAAGTLLLLLKEGPRDFQLAVTPGAASAMGSKASVRLTVSDFLALTAGKKKVALLLATGRLSVRGDLSHALKLSGLLGG